MLNFFSLSLFTFSFFFLLLGVGQSDQVEYCYRFFKMSWNNGCFLSWQIVSKLKDEITVMEREHSDLQLHIERTDWWCENFGMWKASINASEVWPFHVQM